MTVPTHDICAGSPENVFERCSWFYALCRELLFTDHTDEIASTMTPLLEQSCRPILLEVGCGPGFYSSKLAKLHNAAHMSSNDIALKIPRDRISANGHIAGKLDLACMDRAL